MSNRQKRKREAQDLAAQHIIPKVCQLGGAIEDGWREIMVWICIGCWGGVVPVPPFREGKWVDVGIDLLYNDENYDGRGEVQPVKRNHVCPGTKYVLSDPVKAKLLAATFPNGNWHAQVIRISLASYDRLMSTGFLSPGSPTIDPR